VPRWCSRSPGSTSRSSAPTGRLYLAHGDAQGGVTVAILCDGYQKTLSLQPIRTHTSTAGQDPVYGADFLVVVFELVLAN